MNFSTASQLEFIKSIPINRENESVIRNKVQNLFFKTLCECENAETVCEKYFVKFMISGCRDILRGLNDHALMSRTSADFSPCRLSALLRSAAAACTFLLSPQAVVLESEEFGEISCNAESILWCVLSLIDAAVLLESRGQITVRITESAKNADITVRCALLSPAENTFLPDRVSLALELCRKTAVLHGGNSFHSLGKSSFSAGFSVALAKNEAKGEDFPICSAYELLADRLSPVYAALSDCAPCLI